MSFETQTPSVRSREAGVHRHARECKHTPSKPFRVAFPWYAASLGHMHGPGTAQLRERLKRHLTRSHGGPARRIMPNIAPILADARMFHYAIEALANYFRDHVIDAVATIEAAGFIIAAPLALELSAGLIPIRKLKQRDLARGELKSARPKQIKFEPPADLITPGHRILLADDVLASGTTMQACAELVQSCGATVAGCAFLVELPAFDGRSKLGNLDVFSLLVLE